MTTLASCCLALAFLWQVGTMIKSTGNERLDSGVVLVLSVVAIWAICAVGFG